MTYDFGRFTEAEYLQSIRGKKVIIVGPAGYLQGKGLGEWIDSFDLVVRVNHAVPVAFPEDYGARTDVLYHILSHRNPALSHKTLVDRSEVLEWKKAGIKWLVSRHSAISKRVREIGPVINSLVPWCCMHHTFYAKAKMTIGSKSPNTGIAAIMHLLSVNIRSLHIVGFDLYKTGVYPGYGDVGENEDALEINDRWHDTNAQVAYLKTLIKRDNRVHIDEHLSEILEI